MNFTTTPPTTPGYFVIQHRQNKCRSLAEVYKSYVGLAVCFGDAVRELDEWFNNYEWCRLVPAEEVEKAWKEFVETTPYMTPELEAYRWNKSRAKKIAEG